MGKTTNLNWCRISSISKYHPQNLGYINFTPRQFQGFNNWTQHRWFYRGYTFAHLHCKAIRVKITEARRQAPVDSLIMELKVMRFPSKCPWTWTCNNVNAYIYINTWSPNFRSIFWRSTPWKQGRNSNQNKGHLTKFDQFTNLTLTTGFGRVYP